MKVALLQMDIVLGDKRENYKKVEKMMAEAIENNPAIDLFVLPELWTYPFYFQKNNEVPSMEQQLEDYGESLNGETMQFIKELAARYHVWIVAGSLPLRDSNENYKNTCVILNRQGRIVDQYSKVHLCNWCGEANAFCRGEELKVVDTEFGKLQPVICYDIRFPELVRSGALSGTQILVVSSDFGHKVQNPKVDIWRTLLKARAIENMIYVIACDRCGEGPENCYFGHSMIIDPYGKVIAEGGEEECIVIGDIDVTVLEKARKEIPIYEDRQPDVYRIHK